MNIPAELKYSKEHEWVRIESNTAFIGVTDYAQNELGDVVYVGLDIEIGDDVTNGDIFGSIETVKSVSDLFNPIKGTLLEFNETLNENPTAINKDPYGDGWIIKVEIKDSSVLDQLLSAEEYKAII